MCGEVVADAPEVGGAAEEPGAEHKLAGVAMVGVVVLGVVSDDHVGLRNADRVDQHRAVLGTDEQLAIGQTEEHQLGAKQLGGGRGLTPTDLGELLGGHVHRTLVAVGDAGHDHLVAASPAGAERA